MKRKDKTKKIYAENAGQTLVEILIALGIAISIITSMTVVVTSAINNTTYGKNQNFATEYAQEGMEIVKQMQINNYQTFSTLSGRYCLAQTCSTVSTSTGTCGLNSGGTGVNCSPNVNNNTFIRQIDILAPRSVQAKCFNTIQATVSVLWTDGKCLQGTYCHTEQLVSCFSDTHVVAIP